MAVNVHCDRCGGFVRAVALGKAVEVKKEVCPACVKTEEDFRKEYEGLKRTYVHNLDMAFRQANENLDKSLLAILEERVQKVKDA